MKAKIQLTAVILLTTLYFHSTHPWPVTSQTLPDFQLLESFDNLLDGSINTQSTWVANLSGAEDGAMVTSYAPPIFSGKTMFINPRNVQYRGNAYNPLGATQINDGQTGTLFFQIYHSNLLLSNLSVGLSDVAAPAVFGHATSFDNFEVQLLFNDDGLVIRNGSSEQIASNIALQSATLYHIWLIANNISDTFQVYIEGGSVTSPLLVETAGATSIFSFRNGTSSPLKTYLQMNHSVTPPIGDTFIDNLYVDPDASNLNHPAPKFIAVDHFDGLSSGNLNGQNGWSASSSNIDVVNDPADSSNKVMAINGDFMHAVKGITAVSNTQTGTLFFRMRRNGNVDANIGLTNVGTPTAVTDFQTQLISQNSSTLKTRHGSSEPAVGTFNNSAWYCIWMVINNSNDTYKLYLRGDSIDTITQLSASGQTNFGFRTGTTSSLSTFFVRSESSSSGPVYLDDIYIDPQNHNFGNPAGTDTCGVPSDPPLSDPIPESISKTGLNARAVEFATIPPSSSSTPLTRINYVGHSNDGSGRYFVPDLRDKLHVINNGVVSTYLNVKAQFPNFVDTPNLGTGFGFVAFHPEFASNGKFYTVHTEAGSALTSKTPDYRSPMTISVHGVIVEWTATNPAANTFSGTQREILRIGNWQFLHGIQQISFNPLAQLGDEDYGLLYLALGDGERNPDWTDGPQNLSYPQGKILRINPLGNNSPNGKYGIPATNPFVGVSGALGEIWAYGFRNPHRFSWDSRTGQMYIGMIGEKNIESVLLGFAGANYGWNEREGAFRFKKSDPNHVYPLLANEASFGFTKPIAHYDHDEGDALLGGFVYRGSLIPALVGKYIFGDVVKGNIYYFDVDNVVLGTQTTIYELTLLNAAGSVVDFRTNLVGQSRADLRFGMDEDGELFLLSKQNGKIWRLVNGTSPAAAVVARPVTTWVAGDGLHFAWDDVSPNCSYNVHRRSAPYYAPTAVSLYATLPDSDNYIDGSILSATANQFYFVEAVNCDGGQKAVSNHTGIFHFAIQPGN